jgi:hypothetical protein
MKAKAIKIILTILIIYGVYYLTKTYPDQMILIIGISSIIIIGTWLLQADKEEYT